MPHYNAFSMVKIYYIKILHYSYCSYYGVKADEKWMNRDWFYATAYGSFSDGGKATERSPPDDLT